MIIFLITIVLSAIVLYFWYKNEDYCPRCGSHMLHQGWGGFECRMCGEVTMNTIWDNVSYKFYDKINKENNK